MSGLQKYFDLMTTAGQDLTFVTERAIVGSMSDRHKLDVRTRVERISMALDHSARIVDGLVIDHRRLMTEVATLREQTFVAITGLHAFLVSILQLEMSEAARVTIQEQIDVIQQVMKARQESDAQAAAQISQGHERINGKLV
jgi:hypothetical protein